MTFRPTRRHMLASAAASGAAFSTGLYGVASAQDVKRIEQFAPEFDKIIGSSVGLHDHVVRPVEAPTLEPQTSPSAVRTGRYSITNWNFLGSVNIRIAGMRVPAVKKA